MSKSQDENVRIIRMPESTKDHPITFLTKEKCKYTYVYITTKKIYEKAQKYNKNKRVCIGRLDYKLDDDWKESKDKYPKLMVPNSKFPEYFSLELHKVEVQQDYGKDPSGETHDDAQDEEEIKEERSDAISIGPYIFMKQLVDDYKLRSHLQAKLTEKQANQILDFATYMIVMQKNSALHFEYYEHDHMLFQSGNGIKDEQVGRLFAKINQNIINQFLIDWNKQNQEISKKAGNKRIYIAADGSDHHCQAGDIEIAEYGKAKVNDGTPIISMMTAYDLVSLLLIYYDLYDGSLTDMAECEFLMQKLTALGYKKYGLVLDRGFFSLDNIKKLNANDIAFIIMAKGCKKFIRKQMLEVLGTFEYDTDFRMKKHGVFGTTITHSMTEDEHIQYFHIFYNPNLVAKDRITFDRNLKLWDETLRKLMLSKEPVDKRSLIQLSRFYIIEFDDNGVIKSFVRNKEEVKNEYKLAGYYAIITSEKMTAEQALTYYLSRDVNEKTNMFDKTFLGNRVYRVAELEQLFGKGFVSFIGLVLRNGIYVKLLQEEERVGKKKQIYDVPVAMQEVNKIVATRFPNQRYALRRPLSKKQKDIYRAIGLTGKKLKKAIQEAVDRLNSMLTDVD